MRALIAIILLTRLLTAAAAQGIDRVVGEDRKHVVQQGETLLQIARRFGTDETTLARLNSLQHRALKPGRELILPTRQIIPRRIRNGLVLNIPERGLYVFVDGILVTRLAVAVGMPGWPTPTGEYAIGEMIADPVWVTPAEMVRRKGIAPGTAGARSSKNPLGDRWMGWRRFKGTGSVVGFHGTNDPASIGTLASHACVRLYPEDARYLFEEAYPGLPVLSIYEPIKIGKLDGRYYLSVSPDVYGRGLVTEARAKALLSRAGLLAFTDPRVLKRALERQDGFPVPIGAETASLEVNGASVEAPVAPMLLNGAWMVPAAAAIRALGGAMFRAPEGIRLRLNGEELRIGADGKEAACRGQSLPLPARPVIVDGTTLIPARALTALGMELRVSDGRIQVSSPPRTLSAR